MSDDFRAQVAGLASMGSITLRGEEYSGAYLAMLVNINPQLPVAEASRTPQLMAELGRLVAAASFETEMAELRYRQWRDGTIMKLMTDIEYVNEWVDPEATKTLSKTAAETAVRTFPEYAEHSEAKFKAAEAHAMLHSAFEAARARTRAIYTYENTSQGGMTHTPDDDENGVSHEYDPPSRPRRKVDDEQVRQMEQQVEQGMRTPIPTTSMAGPPPDPNAEPEQPKKKSKKKKRAAPPPPR